MAHPVAGGYESGGYGHVAAYLTELDLSAFDPKAPPPKTERCWDIVNASRSPEDAELADLLDTLGNPLAFTLTRLQTAATGDLVIWLTERKNRRLIPHRLETCGYTPVRNNFAKDGLWKISGARQVIYAKSDLPAGGTHLKLRKQFRACTHKLRRGELIVSLVASRGLDGWA